MIIMAQNNRQGVYLLVLKVKGHFFKLGGGLLEGIIYQKGAVLFFEHVIPVTFKSCSMVYFCATSKILGLK